jgi:hypothetical protein
MKRYSLTEGPAFSIPSNIVVTAYQNIYIYISFQCEYLNAMVQIKQWLRFQIIADQPYCIQLTTTAWLAMNCESPRICYLVDNGLVIWLWLGNAI